MMQRGLCLCLCLCVCATKLQLWWQQQRQQQQQSLPNEIFVTRLSQGAEQMGKQNAQLSAVTD